MIDCDYYVVQAPMTVQLKLKGYDLTVFAVIHGFTKDGEHKFKGSAEYIAEKWLGDKGKARAVKDSLKVLIEAGYVNRYKEGNINSYDTNYRQLLENLEAGIMPPSLGKKHRGKIGDSGTVPPSGIVVPYHQNSGTVPPKVVVPYHPISIINIINYFLKSARTREEEEKQVYFLFFFKGAKAPDVEVREFFRFNDLAGWQDGKGRKYDTPQKRLLLADGWEFKKGGAGRESDKFLETWNYIWQEAMIRKDPIAPKLLNPEFHFYVKENSGKLFFRVSKEVQEWMSASGGYAIRRLKDLRDSMGFEATKFDVYD